MSRNRPGYDGVTAAEPARHPATPVVFLAAAWLFQGALVTTYLFHITQLGRLGILLRSAALVVLLALCLLPFTGGLLRRPPGRSRRILLALLLTLVHCSLLLLYAIMVLGCKGLNFMPTPQLMAAYARPLLAAVLVPDAAHLRLGVSVALVGLSLAFAYYLTSGPMLQALESAPRSRHRLPGARPVVVAALAACACLYALSYRHWIAHEPLHMFLLAAGGEEKMIPRGVLKVRRGSTPPVINLPAPSAVHLRPRNLVLITIDALRSDQMQVYGSPYADTPFLSGLYRAGKLRRVERAYSVCTFSFCGMLGTLSSSYWHQLSGSSLMLTDALIHYGYQCRLFLSGDHTHFLGLRQYYGSNITEFRDGSSVRWNEMNDDRMILPWLRQITWPAGQPTFLGIHLMSVHFLGNRQPAFERWRPSEVSSESLLAGHPAPAAYRNHYRNGVLQADDELRQIFDLLEKQGVLQSALVIITADHGESLGELGRFGHGLEPYEPVVRIPLLIYDQSGADYPERALTSQVDIAPTFLRAIGAPVPAEWSGTPLQAASDHGAVAVASSEVSGIVGLSDGVPYKYWRRREGGGESLFSLAGQPAEQLNLAGDPGSAKVLREMRGMYSQIASQRSADPSP